MTFAGIKTALVMCAALVLICGGLLLATATALSTATSASSVGSPPPGIIPETAAEENKLPDELTNTANMYRQDLVRAPRNLARIGYIPAPKFPTWSFKLEKDVYHPGEMIYGRLTIKNEDPKYRFVFIPPYHGALVDNVEAWFQKTDEKKLTRAWPYLKNLIGSWDNSIRGGVPVVLEPGETYEVLIAINSYWIDGMAGDERHGFYGASVMNQPGEYRFYLRYLNLHAHRQIPSDSIRKPKADRIYEWPAQDMKRQKRQELIKAMAAIGKNHKPVIELEDKPIILGPFTVKIEPWPTDKENEAAGRLFKMWDHIAGEPTDLILVQPKPDPKLVKELLKTFLPSTQAPGSVGAMLKLHSWIASYPDIDGFDNEANVVRLLTQEEITKQLTPMLKELRAMKTDEKSGVLRDLMCYWEVRALIDLGERSEALKAARENPTPDIMMLIGVRIGLKFNDKWREDGAPYAIPADDYTAPEPPPAAEEEPQPPAPPAPPLPPQEDHSWPCNFVLLKPDIATRPRISYNMSVV